MEREKRRSILVYREKEKVCVTVAKVITNPYCCDSKKTVVRRWLPFWYMIDYDREVVLDDELKSMKIYKGDRIKVNYRGECFVNDQRFC